jgi:putative transposase
MPNYIRSYIPGGTYFFTVNLLERRRRLLIEHIEPLRNAFRVVKQDRPFHIEAIAR